MMLTLMPLGAIERREALSKVLRAAAGHGVVGDRGWPVVPCLFPPVPPDQESSRNWALATREGGCVHRFFLFRKTVATFWRAIPWIFSVLVGVCLGFTKRRAAFATSSFPRTCLFFPRVAMFYQRFCFLNLCAFFFFFYFFKREIERREGGNQKKGASTGWVLDPWIENLQVVEKRGVPRVFRGCSNSKKTIVFNGLHDLLGTSTGLGGDFPPPPPVRGVF